MEIELRHHLNSLAASYAALRGLELVTVARLAAGDWRFLTRINGGKTFTVRKYDQIVAWFRGNWPEGADFPEITLPKDGGQ